MTLGHLYEGGSDAERRASSFPTIFRNPELEAAFERKGYVVVRLLGAIEVARLSRVYRGLRSNSTSGFHATLFSRDREYRVRIDREIQAVIAPAIEEWVSGYRPLVGNFVVKGAGRPDSAVPVHQDWTFVDERSHRSINVWCPLVDVCRENGALGVLGASHRFVQTVRGPSVPSAFAGLESVIREKYLTEIPLDAGEAVLYDHRLVHASPPNTTSDERVAASLSLVPSSVPAIHVYLRRRDPAPVIEIVEVDDEFFTRHNAGEPPARVTNRGCWEGRITRLTELDLAHLYEVGRGELELARDRGFAVACRLPSRYDQNRRGRPNCVRLADSSPQSGKEMRWQT